MWSSEALRKLRLKTKFLRNISEGNTAKVRKYLEAGGSANFSDDELDAPLSKATTIEMAKILIQYKADLEHRDDSGFTVLQMACMRNQVDMARFLLENGANVHVTEYMFSYDPLEIACDKGNVDIVNLLLEYGKKPCALSMAETVETAKILVEHGVDPNKPEFDGMFPFECAIHKREDVFEYVLSITDLTQVVHSESVSNVDRYGQSILHKLCCYSKNNMYLEKILNKLVADLK